MNATLEAVDHRPRSRSSDARRVRSIAFSWSVTLNLPVLKQSRLRGVSCGLSELWLDTRPRRQAMIPAPAASLLIIFLHQF